MVHALNTVVALKEIEEHDQHRETYPPIVSGRFGRPRFDISIEQLSYLLENRFTSCSSNIKMLGVSERTIYRRMNQFSLSVRMQYSTIFDDDLDNLICEIQEMLGMLKCKGIYWLVV